MRLKSLGVFFVLLCPLAFAFHNDPQPPNDAVYAGSSRFGDQTCQVCHAGTAVNSSNGNLKLLFNNAAATTYAPGTTIPIQITITDTGSPVRKVWGFELASRFSNGKQAGTLKAINSNTATLGGIFGQTGLTVITHNNAVLQTGTSFTFTVNWTAPADGSGGTIYFSAAGNAGNFDGDDTGDRIYTTEVAQTPAAAQPTPSVPSNGVVEGAGFSAKISGGGIGSIFGTNLAAATTFVSALPLPTTLGGTSVTMNGIQCGLFFVSSGQINFQVPWELLSAASSSLTVTTAGGTSTPITVTLSSTSPGIFTIGTTNSATQAAAQISNTTTYVAPVGAIPGSTSQPAKAGDFITIFVSGLGSVSNMPADYAADSGNPLSSSPAGSVTVTVGATTVTPGFAGLSPGFVGLYQVNIQIPPGLGANNALPVVVTAANLKSNTATIAVQ